MVMWVHSDLCDVETAWVDGSATVTVSGEIDAHSVLLLDAALRQLAPDTQCRVDLGEVRFIDSSGLRALILHTVRLREAGGSLAVSNASAPVRRVALIAGVAELVDER
jgi:anti-anti-sigma factor